MSKMGSSLKDECLKTDARCLDVPRYCCHGLGKMSVFCCCVLFYYLFHILEKFNQI